MGQKQERLVADLRNGWQVFEDNEYRPYEGGKVRKIFFFVDAARFTGDWLRIADHSPFGIFINHQLVAARSGGSVQFRIDSLGKLYAGPIVISVYQKEGISSLSTNVVSNMPVPLEESGMDRIVRKGNFFQDFSLATTLLLSIYLVFLMGTHPRLAFDYLNASKLFSVQEREENLLASRITSRVNLLFYLFCSLFCSLILLVVFHLAGDQVPLANYFPVRSTAEGFLQWMKLSLLIALLLLCKLVIVLISAMLFKLRDTAAVQYFHFVRALFLAAGLITLISLASFVFGAQSAGLHAGLLKVGAIVLVISAAMMYLKLLGLTRYPFFHLFSYLCASEIIPLVILVKVLLY